ncbi:hypothetical protein [Microlunatus sagamiharensis]|uniref:hypothetical protein n=1 Tax=Microlunatus sagamiharensis TaxID=546874 RepID=UPI0012FE5DA2|nr:hypothetical protein [Microlunatus sagamiharensis]
MAGHLVAAGELIDTDPKLAYAHAEAARRRAARLPVVREAAAETAYAAGEYAAALSEYRALRRMTGAPDYLPVMADCERALGNPQRALTLSREAADLDLPPALRVEMTIVAAGARADLGQQAEAVRMLRQAVAAPAPARTESLQGRGAASARQEEQQAAARLRYAFADALLQTGATEEARRMFAEAARRDPEQLTDAQQRVDELDGLTLDLEELELDDLDGDLEDDDEESDDEESDESDDEESDDEHDSDDADEDDADEDDADADDADHENDDLEAIEPTDGRG